MRIFEIPFKNNDNSTIIRYYTSTRSKELANLKPYESPSSLQGLSSYLNELITDTNSTLYLDYYQNRKNEQVVLKTANYSINNNYLDKGD